MATIPSRGPLPPSIGGGVARGATALPAPSMGRASIPGQALPPSMGAGQTQGTPLDEDLQRRLMRLLAPSPAGPETTVDTGTGMRTDPPEGPEDKERRKQGFRAMLEHLVNDPNGRQAMLTAAAQIMQPVQAGSGENALTRLIQGAVTGTSTYNQLNQEQTEMDLRERLLEARTTEAETRAEETAEKQRANAELIQSVVDDPTVDQQTKTRFSALVRSGNTKDALELAFEKKGAGQVLSPEEILELNPNIDPSRMIVTRKANGDYSFTEIPEEGGTGGGNTLTERSAQMYKQILIDKGMDPEQAEVEGYRVATGETSIQTSEDGTRTTLVRTLDVLSGDGTGAEVIVAEPPRGSGSAKGNEVPVEQTLFGEAAEVGPGLTGFYHNVLANIPSPFKGDLTDTQEATVKARRRMALANRNMIKAVALNPRYIGQEQQDIKEEFGIEPALLTNPPALRARLEAVDEKLASDIALGEQDLKDNTFVDAEKVQNLRASIRDMKNFRKVLGVQRSKDMREKLTVNKAQRLTADEMNFLLLTSDPEELAELPDPVFDALEERRVKLLGSQ